VTSALALLTLGILNTGSAYWLFYLLIDEAGAATASVITYVMPGVALLLGVGLLGETLTIGAIAGLILIALGAWLATGRHRQARASTEDSKNHGHARTSPQPRRRQPIQRSRRSQRQAQLIAPLRDRAQQSRHSRGWERPPVLFPGQYGALAGQAPAERELTEGTRGTSAFTWSCAPAQPGIRHRVATMGALPCCSRPWQ
jgi:ABC-type nickel/cobalt efflux system permease component RcnA